MKKILFLLSLVIVLLTSCCTPSEPVEYKYELGDEVIWKVTGKSVLISCQNASGSYDIKYADELGVVHSTCCLKEWELAPIKEETSSDEYDLEYDPW